MHEVDHLGVSTWVKLRLLFLLFGCRNPQLHVRTDVRLKGDQLAFLESVSVETPLVKVCVERGYFIIVVVVINFSKVGRHSEGNIEAIISTEYENVVLLPGYGPWIVLELVLSGEAFGGVDDKQD